MPPTVEREMAPDGDRHDHDGAALRQTRQFADAGEARLAPDAAVYGSTLATNFNSFVRGNAHVLLIALVVLFFAARRAAAWWRDQRSLAAVRAVPRVSDETIAEGLRAARERQMLAAREAAKRDAELKERQRREELAERERRAAEARATAGATAGDSAPQTELPFQSRLPTLPSGAGYRPSSDWSSGGGGGGYRPTGFRRPARGG